MRSKVGGFDGTARYDIVHIAIRKTAFYSDEASI